VVSGPRTVRNDGQAMPFLRRRPSLRAGGGVDLAVAGYGHAGLLPLGAMVDSQKGSAARAAPARSPAPL